MTNTFPGRRVHLELRRSTFLLYTDGGKDRIELPYGDADEVVAHLTRVISSEEYLLAERLPPTMGPEGALLGEGPRPVRITSKRNRMRILCRKCKDPINDKRMVTLSQRVLGYHACQTCFTQEAK